MNTSTKEIYIYKKHPTGFSVTNTPGSAVIIIIIKMIIMIIIIIIRTKFCYKTVKQPRKSHFITQWDSAQLQYGKWLDPVPGSPPQTRAHIHTHTHRLAHTLPALLPRFLPGKSLLFVRQFENLSACCLPPPTPPPTPRKTTPRPRTSAATARRGGQAERPGLSALLDFKTQAGMA